MNSMKRQKDMTAKDGLSCLVNGKEQKNTSSRNKEPEPKQKQCPVVAVSSGESKVRFYKNNNAEELECEVHASR